MMPCGLIDSLQRFNQMCASFKFQLSYAMFWVITITFKWRTCLVHRCRKQGFIRTLWGRDKVTVILQTAFQIDFFGWILIVAIQSLFVRFHLPIDPNCFRQCFGIEQAISHYMNQCLPCLLMHIWFRWPHWVMGGRFNLLWEISQCVCEVSHFRGNFISLFMVKSL